MSSAMRTRLTEAKTAADKSVKDKSARGPLSDPLPDLHLVSASEEPGAAEPAPEAPVTALPEGSTLEGPVEESPAPVATLPAVPAAGRRRRDQRPADSSDLLAQLAAPPAAMGMAAESRLLGVPMTEDAYRLLQQLDRDMALSRRRPVNRVRLLTLALERVLREPRAYHDRYVQMHDSGASWKRRVQARIPVGLADELPALRYTGEFRQSAGMLVSMAVAELLASASAELEAAPPT